MKPAVAFVVQRYGTEIAGGSESLAREVAERLCADYRITVFTTCARDYVSWRNELPAGREELSGVEILRFASEEERDLASFNAFSDSLYARPDTDEVEQQLWLRRQGPYVPELVRQLAVRRDRFAAVVFFTYLYYPTYWGLKTVPEHSVLVPTAHDEPPLRFGIYRDVFTRPRAMVFCSAPEERLVRSRFPLGDRPSAVAGMGIDAPAKVDVEGFRIGYDVRGGYILYAGRIDAGKGCAELLRFYERYRRDVRGAAELLLIGRLNMPLPAIPGLRYLGYLSEAEKRSALAGARAVVCPSHYESLSIVLLEGFALGTPALVTAHSPVLRDHCVRSNAGLFYSDADEFVEAVELLTCESGLRRAMGENGRRYVGQHYRWETVLGKYRAMIESAMGPVPR